MTTDMRLHLSRPLPGLVSRRYAAAKEAGDLLFSPTTLAVIQAEGIPVRKYPPYSPNTASSTRHISPEKIPIYF